MFVWRKRKKEREKKTGYECIYEHGVVNATPMLHRHCVEMIRTVTKWFVCMCRATHCYGNMLCQLSK